MSSKTAKNIETTNKKITSGLDGFLYQNELLLFTSHRALLHKLKFSLGTEIEEAGKLDDLVLEYADGIDTKYLLMQIKNKQDPLKLNFNNLMGEGKSPFNIVKYFRSYMDSNETKLFNGKIKYAIMYTNADVDLKSKINNPKPYTILQCIENITKEILIKDDNVLQIFKTDDSSSKCYKFVSDEFFSIFKTEAEKAFYEDLADQILKDLNKQTYFSSKNYFYGKVDNFLLENIIDNETKKFHRNFINFTGDKEECEKSRIILYLKNALEQKSKTTLEKFNESCQFLLSLDFGENYVHYVDKNKFNNWYTVSLDDVKEFFSKYIFAVKQPSEEKLKETVQKELNDVFFQCDIIKTYENLKRKIDSWKRDKSQSRFIFYKDILKVFEKEEKIVKLFLSGPVSEYENKISKLGIEFDDENFSKCIDIFFNDDSGFMYIESLETRLTSIKFYKILKRKYEINYIFMRLTTLYNSLEYVFRVLQNHCCRILIIENDMSNDESNSAVDLQNFFYQFEQLFQNFNDKKVIIITNKNSLLEELKKRFLYKVMEKNDEKIRFVNLQSDSKIKILKKQNTVIFQGKEMCLEELISVSGDVINAKNLAKIVFDDKIIIGSSVNISKDISCYIDRILSFRININEDEICIDFSERDFHNLNDVSLKNILEYSKNQAVIEELTRLKNKNIFFESDKTHNSSSKDIGNIGKQTKFSDLEPSKNLIVNKISNTLKNSIVFIGGDAGIGKTTLLENLTQRIKENHPEYWVGKINLTDVTEKLIDIKYTELKGILDFLFYGLKINTEIEKECFRYLSNNQKIILYFDSFDEICPIFKETVLDLIQIIDERKMAEKIWISTRSYDYILVDILKTKTNKSFFEIKPFSRENQELFLNSYWINSRKIDQTRIKEFVNLVLDIFDENMCNDFTGNALHTKMIAINLESVVDTFCESSAKTVLEDQKILINELLNLDQLYNKFVDGLNSFSGTKKSEKYKKVFMYEKYIRSLEFLFDKKNLLPSILKEINDANEVFRKIGIENEIDEIVKGLDSNRRPIFLHRTYAEWFAARWFINAFRKSSANQREMMLFFFTNVLQADFTMICKFVDGAINEELSEILKRYFDSQMIECIKINNERIFSFTIENGFLKTAKFLVNAGFDVNIETGNESVLHLAAKINDYQNLDELLKSIRKNHCQFLKLISNSNSIGETPLLVAVKQNNYNGVKAIWENIDDDLKWKSINMITKEKNTIFHLATKGIKTLQILLNYIDEYCDNVRYSFKNKIDKSEVLQNIFFKTNYNDDTIFHKMAREKYNGCLIYTINWLKERNQNIDSVLRMKNKQDSTILHSAANNPNSGKMVSQILDVVISNTEKLKILLFSKGFYNRTPLQYACSAGHEDNMKLLLMTMQQFESLDCIINYEGIDGATILHLATSNSNNSKMVAYILDMLSSNTEELKKLLFSKSFHGRMALHIACRKGQKGSVQQLLKAMQQYESLENILAFKNKNDAAALHLAAINSNSAKVVTYILDILPDSDSLKKALFLKGFHGKIPLQYACSGGHEDTVKLLFKTMQQFESTKFIQNIKDDDGYTILHLAVKSSNAEKILAYILNEILLNPDELRRQLFLKGFFGRIPIHDVLCNSNMDNTKKLLNIMQQFECIDTILNIKDNNNDTMLHLAACNPYTEKIVTLILDRISSNIEELKKFIFFKGFNGRTPLHSACLIGHEKSVIQLLGAMQQFESIEFILNMKDNDNSTIMHLAAGHPNTGKIVTHILSLVSNTEELKKVLFSKGFCGRTPLHGGCVSGHIDNVKQLLVAMQQFESMEFIQNIKDDNGSVILNLAASHSCTEKVLMHILSFMISNVEELKKLLFSRGFRGRTPLHNACREGRVESVKKLLSAMQQFERMEFILNIKDDSGITILDSAAYNSAAKSIIKLMQTS